MANIKPMAGKTHGAARFTRKLTDQQTQAILHAHLIDGHTPREIRTLAETGTLLSADQDRRPLPAFTLTTYVYNVIKRGRDAFEGENATALAQSTAAELKRLHRLNLAKSRALTNTSDVAEIARVAEALRKTERALGTEAKPKPPKNAGQSQAPSEPTSNTPTSPDVLSTLLANAPKTTSNGARTGSLDRARGGVEPSSA